MYSEIVNLEYSLDQIFSKFDRLLKDPSLDLDIRHEIEKYLYVRISSYVEQSMITIVDYYLENRPSNAKTLALFFKEKWFDRGFNAKWEKVRALIGSIDKSSDQTLVIWRQQGQNENIASKLDMVIDIRNEIAHKGVLSPNKGPLVNFTHARDSYKELKELIKQIYSIMIVLL